MNGDQQQAALDQASADPLDLLQATSLLGECYQRFGKPHHLSLSFVAGDTQINISLMRFEREESDECTHF